MNSTVTRTVSGAAFAVITLASLLFCKYIFAAYFLFIMVAMMVEFYRMGLGDNYKCARILAICAGCTLFVLMFCAAAFGMPYKFVALAIIPVMAVMIDSLFVSDKSEFGKFAHIYTGLLYIAVPLSLINLIAIKEGEFNGILIVSFFIIIWCSDVGAYIFGMGFGQRPDSRKLCPAISPKKSWAGFWGGLITAVIAGIVLRLTGLFTFPMLHCAALALLMSVAGVFGDLFESQWKRYYNLKDSGNIIPGHGGMLDRFDSAIFAITAGALYMSLFNLL